MNADINFMLARELSFFCGGQQVKLRHCDEYRGISLAIFLACDFLRIWFLWGLSVFTKNVPVSHLVQNVKPPVLDVIMCSPSEWISWRNRIWISLGFFSLQRFYAAVLTGLH